MSNVDYAEKYVDLMVTLRAAPGGERLMERLSARTYADFVVTLRKDLDCIVEGMEKNPQRFINRSEDDLTYYIGSMLGQWGYAVAHGKQAGGSVDLTVEKPEKGWVWTAEAKIFTAMEKVQEGFKQLSGRYAPGSLEEAKAGMLIYIYTKNASAKMNDWRKHLPVSESIVSATADCPVRPNLAFYSTHIHDGSGLPVEVRHLAVTLYFKPTDKSGRNAKKYKTAPAAKAVS